MIPESLNSSTGLFVVGGVVLAIGCLIAAVGAVIGSRHAERDRDQRYVRRKRGEDLPAVEPPQAVRALEYLGGAVALIGIVVLVAAWTLTPGQS
jgi:hypothetical protein